MMAETIDPKKGSSNADAGVTSRINVALLEFEALNSKASSCPNAAMPNRFRMIEGRSIRLKIVIGKSLSANSKITSFETSFTFGVAVMIWG